MIAPLFLNMGDIQMNAEFLKKIAPFVIGAAVGGTAGFFAGKFIYQKFQADDYEWSVDDNNAPAGDDSAEPVDIINVEKHIWEPEIPMIKKGNMKNKKVDYNAITASDAAKHKKIIAKYTVKAGADDVETETTEINKEIYVISLEQYITDNTFEKETLTYYEEDDQLCDEEEVLIADMAALLGEHEVLDFGAQSDDPDVVYIRNVPMGTDYEVTRSKGAYSEIVLGQPAVIEVPVKKAKKKGKAVNEDV